MLITQEAQGEAPAAQGSVRTTLAELRRQLADPASLSDPDQQRLLDLVPSHCNAAEFCQGTIAEMDGEMDVYEAIRTYTAQGKIAYVHLRNVRGRVPEYYETFIDDGDVDMVRALRLYYENGFDGVLIPDHSPEMSCAAPWHAGMAYALGWMRAVIGMIERGG